MGDWVKYKGNTKIQEISHRGYHLSNGYITSGTNGEIRLWQPEEGEVITTTDKSKVYLVEFIGMYEKRYVCRHLDGFSETFDSVEPFIGELPSFLKESK